MAEQQIPLVPSGARDGAPWPYPIMFANTSRVTAGVTYEFGSSPLDGPVVLKTAAKDSGAAVRLQRELDVARYLQTRGGERLSKCIGYSIVDSSFSTIVTYRGRPLVALVRDEANWPLGHDLRMKIIDDLLQSVEMLRVSSIVHGAIELNTLHWDGNTLQLVDFGGAALCGRYPDERPAHHGDDVLAAGRVIYQVHTGQRAPDDDVELRRQIQHVQDDDLRKLLLHHDLVSDIDIDYVFAREPGMRPTSRVLLDRIDRRPRGITWARLVAEDDATRAEFQQLRSKQAQVRALYASSVRVRPQPPPRGPQPIPRHDPEHDRGTTPPPPPEPGTTTPERRHEVMTTVIAVIVAVVVLAAALLLVLR